MNQFALVVKCNLVLGILLFFCCDPYEMIKKLFSRKVVTGLEIRTRRRRTTGAGVGGIRVKVCPLYPRFHQETTKTNWLPTSHGNPSDNLVVIRNHHDQIWCLWPLGILWCSPPSSAGD